MSMKGIGIIGGAIVVLVIGAVLWIPGEEPREAATPVVQNSTPVPEPVPRDAAGLPPLLPRAEVYPENDISLDEYFAQFGSDAALDLKTKKIREDVATKIREEMVGTQVTWDGYVQRIADVPPGRVTLVLAMTDGPAGLDQAMILFSAAFYDQLHSYQKGDHVRVVAVFDEVVTVFPLLSGKSVESISEEG